MAKKGQKHKQWTAEEKDLISGYIERIGIGDSFYTLKVNGDKVEKHVDVVDH